jgi:hypothetical protein
MHSAELLLVAEARCGTAVDDLETKEDENPSAEEARKERTRTERNMIYERTLDWKRVQTTKEGTRMRTMGFSFVSFSDVMICCCCCWL